MTPRRARWVVMVLPALMGGLPPAKAQENQTIGGQLGEPFTPLDMSRFGAGGTPDDSRFGGRPDDPAFAAFQRGLYLTALNLALADAEKGLPSGQLLAAEIYSRGLGVPRNLPEATRLYLAAAESGHPEAQLQGALILLGGKPMDLSNPNRAEALAMLRASAEQGNANAAFNLAQIVLAETPGDAGIIEARALFETAAARDLPGALYAMARYHLTGMGGAEKDLAKARDLMTKAARAGLDTAQIDLATGLAEGTFGEPDYGEAFTWMRRAAEAGNAVAAVRLAKLVMYGLGVEGDPVKAAAWYIRAKRAGLRDELMEDHLAGLTDEERSAALAAANQPL
jgi:TPR repeat protein